MTRQEWRVNALKRAGYRCERCLMMDADCRHATGRGLHVHHRIRLADGGQDVPENALVVCPGCHAKEDPSQYHHLTPRKKVYHQGIHLQLMDADLEDLRALAGAWRCSESEAARRAVREAVRRERSHRRTTNP